MDEKSEITKWIASSLKFLRKCDPDLRTAALSLLYSRIILEGVFKNPSLDPEKQGKAEEDLAKRFIDAMTDFVSSGRESWVKKTKCKPVS